MGVVNVPMPTAHHSAEDSAANGRDATLDGYYSALALHITDASAAGQNINFEGSINGDDFVSIQGTKISDGTTATSTSGTDEIWQFDVTGLLTFRADLTAITSGTISVESLAVP